MDTRRVERVDEGSSVTYNSQARGSVGTGRIAVIAGRLHVRRLMARRERQYGDNWQGGEQAHDELRSGRAIMRVLGANEGEDSAGLLEEGFDLLSPG